MVMASMGDRRKRRHPSMELLTFRQCGFAFMQDALKVRHQLGVACENLHFRKTLVSAEVFKYRAKGAVRCVAAHGVSLSCSILGLQVPSQT